MSDHRALLISRYPFPLRSLRSSWAVGQVDEPPLDVENDRTHIAIPGCTRRAWRRTCRESKTRDGSCFPEMLVHQSQWPAPCPWVLPELSFQLQLGEILNWSLMQHCYRFECVAASKSMDHSYHFRCWWNWRSIRCCQSPPLLQRKRWEVRGWLLRQHLWLDPSAAHPDHPDRSSRSVGPPCSHRNHHLEHPMYFAQVRLRCRA